MTNFYVIQLINRDGQAGWIISNPPEVLIVNQYVTDVTRFDSWESANMFAKTNNLTQNDSGVIVKIYSNQEIMQMDIPGIKPLKGSLYYLENESGEKCVSGSQGFYFKRCEVGYCAWPQPHIITPLRDEFIQKGIYCEVKEIKQ